MMLIEVEILAARAAYIPREDIRQDSVAPYRQRCDFP